METAYVAFGSNLGDRERAVSEALRRMEAVCTLSRISSLYETEPVGYKKQGWFLNGAVEAATDLPPGRLLAFLQGIEKELGRERVIENGPRTIDLDIVFYGTAVVKERGLEIPHPRAAERRFVLEPLNEIAPEFRHPLLGGTIRELCSCLPAGEAVRLYKHRWFYEGR